MQALRGTWGRSEYWGGRISRAALLIAIGAILQALWADQLRLEWRSDRLETIQTTTLPDIARAAGKGDEDKAQAIALTALGKTPPPAFTPKPLSITVKHRRFVSDAPARPIPDTRLGRSIADALNQAELARIRAQKSRRGQGLPAQRQSGNLGTVARAADRKEIP